MKRTSSLLVFALVLIAAPLLAQDKTAGKTAATSRPKAQAAGSSAGAGAGVPTKWTQVPIPALPEFKPQEPKRIQLTNGMVIFLQEDHELPLVGGSFTIRGGGTEVPKEKIGMMGIYGQTWRLGGTSKLTGDQMDDYLEARAAHVSTSGGLTSTTLSFESLKQDFDDVFKMAVELLKDPAFREDKITLAKTQANGGISRRNDTLGSIVSRETTHIAYGDTPYGRVPEYDTIAAITRADLVDFHKRHLYPNNIILGVYGDFNPQTMEATLRQAFESWPKGPDYQAPKIEFHDPKPGIYFAEKTDVNQAEIRMAHLSIQHNNPDLFAVDVMDEIFFSGGFSARFTNAIRTKRGLAYEAGGNISSPFDHPGVFVLVAGTKSTSAVETVNAMRQEVETMFKEPATPDDLKRAKDAILNSFVFRFDSKDKVLSERVTYEFYGYPADFLERYRAGVEKVTLADVARVAEKYIHPNQLATVIVGNDKEFDKPLSSLGQVTKLDISIPPPGGAKKSAAGEAGAAAPKAAENTPEARALLAKVIDSMGGAAKLQSVKAVKQTATLTQKTPQGDIPLEIESITVVPNQTHVRVQTPQGEMVRVVTPSFAYMSMGAMGTREFPSSMRDEALKDLRRSPIYVAQHANDVKVALGGTEKVGDMDAQVLDVNADGAQTRWFVDPKSGHIIRAQYQGMTPNGPAEVQSDFSDFKTVDGITFAFSSKQSQNGQESASIQVKDVTVNPPVDPKLFEKPPASPQP
jgi:zinc protease